MNLLSRSLSLFLALVYCSASVGHAQPLTKPSGLDHADQMVVVNSPSGTTSEAFSWTELQDGIQYRIGQSVKNVLFYGPRMVRVNESLGQS